MIDENTGEDDFRNNDNSDADQEHNEKLIDKFPQNWSKDGRFLLYGEFDPKTGRDLWALPITAMTENR